MRMIWPAPVIGVTGVAVERVVVQHVVSRRGAASAATANACKLIQVFSASRGHPSMNKRSELRKHPRKSFSHRATIVGLDGSVKGACTLSDVSEAGARLILPAPPELPDEFILVFSRNGPVRRKCSIAWRSSNTIGVRFVQQNEQSRLAPVGV